MVAFLDKIFDFITFGWFKLSSRLVILFFIVWFGSIAVQSLMRSISNYFGF